jgi:hypothetical protein
VSGTGAAERRYDLEMLNLSGNRLTGTLNLAPSLPGLVGLNIGECILILTLFLGALDDERMSLQIIILLARYPCTSRALFGRRWTADLSERVYHFLRLP